MKNTKELVLAKIKETLLQVAPGAKVILFGSRARNDARSDSDWDILILVDKNKLDPDDFDRISYPLYELGWKINEMISPKLYTINDWLKRSFTPFYKNVEKYRRLLTRQESGHIIAMETETKKDIEIYFHFSDFFLFLTISLLLKYYVEGYREVSGSDRIK